MSIVGDIAESCGGSSMVYLIVPMRLQTSDGRVDTALPARFVINGGDGGLTWGWQLETEVLPLSSVASWIDELQPGLADAESMLQVRSGPDSGGLRVIGKAGAETLAALSWCSAAECPASAVF